MAAEIEVQVRTLLVFKVVTIITIVLLSIALILEMVQLICTLAGHIQQIHVMESLLVVSLVEYLKLTTVKIQQSSLDHHLYHMI